MNLIQIIAGKYRIVVGLKVEKKTVNFTIIFIIIRSKNRAIRNKTPRFGDLIPQANISCSKWKRKQ